MANFKIHYLGFGIQHLETDDVISAIYHLGAKYGGRVYNRGISKGAIVLIEDEKTIKVNPEMMDSIYEEMVSAGEIISYK